MTMKKAAGSFQGGRIDQMYQNASSKPVISTLIKIFLEICKSKYQGPGIWMFNKKLVEIVPMRRGHGAEVRLARKVHPCSLREER